MPTHYHALDLHRYASEEEVNDAYRQAAKQAHPDMPTGSVEKFQRVREAFDTLRDPVRRRLHEDYIKTNLPACPACLGSGEAWAMQGFKQYRAGRCPQCNGFGVVGCEGEEE